MADRLDLTDLHSLTTAVASRRRFMSALGAVGAGVAASSLLAACSKSTTEPTGSSGSSAALDLQIISAAATAEALASVMYDNIIKTSPAYASLAGIAADDQAYLVAGRQQEAIHYATLVGAGAKPLTLNFYFPTGMFSDPTGATTINTLITLEDAFIAAYLIGVRDLSTDALKTLAAQILGIECEHRALGRVIANDLSLGATTGLSGTAESVVPPNHAPNNLAFERTFSTALPDISHVVAALAPFTTAGSSGFDSTVFAFNTSSNFYISESPSVTLDDTTP
jgi:hypothetical protein